MEALAFTGLGAILGVGLTLFVEWLNRPRVKWRGFERVETNFGVLYKAVFELGGRRDPGLSCLTIEWAGRQVFAKWDEAPNPLEADRLDAFRPELVPATFYQPLFTGKRYSVPILVQRDGRPEVFSGWWFGHDRGYGPDPATADPARTQVRLALTGARLTWSKSFIAGAIVGRGPE